MSELDFALQELVRRSERAAGRTRIWLERRKLTKAEIHLGILGWQQVDFPPDVEEQIRAITAWELQQTELSNKSADIQWQISDLQSQREQHQKEYQASRTGLESSLAPMMENRAEAAKRLAISQESIQRFGEAIAALDASIETVAAQFRGLLASNPEGRGIHEQVLKVGERRRILENEREDMQLSRMRIFSELKASTEEIESLDLQIAETQRILQEAGEAFEAREREFESQIAVLKAEKQAALKHVDTLDKKKSPAYLAIGRCLADFELAPLNQPHALDEVLAHRQKIAVWQEQIAASLAESAEISPTARALFYAIATIIALILLAIAWHLPKLLL